MSWQKGWLHSHRALLRRGPARPGPALAYRSVSIHQVFSLDPQPVYSRSSFPPRKTSRGCADHALTGYSMGSGEEVEEREPCKLPGEVSNGVAAV